ncbi:MAG: hypothetical protein ABIE22_05485 [archaeon]
MDPAKNSGNSMKAFRGVMAGYTIKCAVNYSASTKKPFPHLSFIFGENWFVPVLSKRDQNKNPDPIKEAQTLVTAIPNPIILNGHPAEVGTILEYGYNEALPLIAKNESRLRELEQIFEEIALLPITRQREQEISEMGTRTYDRESWYLLESGERQYIVFPTPNKL